MYRPVRNLNRDKYPFAPSHIASTSCGNGSVRTCDDNICHVAEGTTDSGTTDPSTPAPPGKIVVFNPILSTL
jgi:hypothetical protein